ncbi:cupin domain-containing protein [Sandarakinorhabdus sp.]|uniref:cupin domain-containing protein n=1 Tax=Sandarakinorhabdus sp. TaxID=1916663 RepID=UPI00286E3FB0|nr:cupin domain-containing protein [Sandarakinorhabdus sp.]
MIRGAPPPPTPPPRLSAHPEGGWYRETLRVPGSGPIGDRAAVTAIHFLLEAGQRSHWHTVDATEIWCWHAGSPLRLGHAARDQDAPVWIILGPDIVAGHNPQTTIPAGHWQAAEAVHGWALVSCIVAPGFEFAGFRLAAPGWSPG